MTFDELVAKIDREIASAKERGRNIWGDVHVDVDKSLEKIRTYYIERGYMIETIPCPSCLGQKADIIISWKKEN